MLKFYPILAVCILCLLSCNKDPNGTCHEPECETYFQIWKDLIKSRNGISDSYYNDHIKPTGTTISNWLNGESFRVDYTIKIDWVTIKTSDKFIIKINDNAPPYPTVPAPRNEYLTKDVIDNILSHLAFASHMNVIQPIEKLKFNSRLSAIKALQEIAGTNAIKVDDFYLKKQTFSYDANGHPFLGGEGTINRAENRCITGEIDLVTGEGKAYEDACWVN